MIGRGRFRDHVAELFTIFAGILLALLADAAWGYSSDRERERDYLARLRDELQASAVELAADERVRADGLEQTASILEAARGRAELSDQEAAHALVALLNFRFFSPARAVLDDLIDSGNLRLIRSDSLRFELQNYLQQLDRLAVVEQRERDFIAESIEPFILSSLRMDDILPLQSYDDPIEVPPATTDAFRALLRDDTMINLAFMRWERSRTAHRFARSVAATIRRLIDIAD